MRVYTAADLLDLRPCAGWDERIPGLVGAGVAEREHLGWLVARLEAAS
jgi:hypothetical protein